MTETPTPVVPRSKVSLAARVNAPSLPPKVWPSARERAAWAWHETPDLHGWRRRIAEGGLVFGVSMVALRLVLDLAGWQDELLVTVISLAAGAVPTALRFFMNWVRAPRQMAEHQLVTIWRDLVALKTERDRLLGERLDVRIQRAVMRPAGLPGKDADEDGRVYALQDTIITNRSDENVSLAFELWLPSSTVQGAWLAIEEHEHSGLGREDPRYVKTPINIGPRTSSECKDIGFLWLPHFSALLGKNAQYDLERAVVRVSDLISQKTVDVSVKQQRDFKLPPPGAR